MRNSSTSSHTTPITTHKETKKGLNTFVWIEHNNSALHTVHCTLYYCRQTVAPSGSNVMLVPCLYRWKMASLLNTDHISWGFCYNKCPPTPTSPTIQLQGLHIKLVLYSLSTYHTTL